MRLIDTDALKADLISKWDRLDDQDFANKAIWEAIESAPTIEPERIKGEWFALYDCANEGVYCSVCHKKVFKIDFSNTMKWKCFKYCPHCGADNRRGEEE